MARSRSRKTNQPKDAEASRSVQPPQHAVHPLHDLQRQAGNQAVSQSLARGDGPSTENHPPPFPVAPHEIVGKLDAGQPLLAATQAQLAEQFGADFGQAQVHDDPRADHIARSLGADAVSVGDHMLFRRGRYQPQTEQGQELIAHEAQHVAAGMQVGGSHSAQPVQLRVSVDDVTEEMNGQSFTVLEAQGTPPDVIPKGASVIIKDWQGTAATALVSYKPANGTTKTRAVPKLALEPDIYPVSDVRLYRVGMGAQRRAVQQQQADVTAWRGREGEYSKNRELWEKELARLEGLLDRKEAELSRMLVRETMYNLFDPSIKIWTDHYNKQFNPSDALDPNVVKSMLFQETRMGTQGEHLMLPGQPGYHVVKSRFNLGQTIDSVGLQQLHMIKEMAPDLFAKYDLDELEKQNRKQGMTNQEFEDWEGGKFARALGEFWNDRDASGQNRMGHWGKKNTDLYNDYSFWIRTAVRWLFHKYTTLPPDQRSWAEAVRAYNGQGARARRYRKTVMGRAGSTKELEVGGQ